VTITTIHTLYDEASINQLPVADFFLDARTGTPRNVDKEPDDNYLFMTFVTCSQKITSKMSRLAGNIFG